MQNDYKPDFHDWYVKQGVSPPQSAIHGIEKEVFDNLVGKVTHGEWQQKGNLITCHKCPTPHGHTIPTENLLMGTDGKGYPILKKVG